MRSGRRICLLARIAGNAAKDMAAPISPSLKLTISVGIWGWIAKDLCAVIVRCPEAIRWSPRQKTVIVYSGISYVRFIRLSRICVENGPLLKVSWSMAQTGIPWRPLVRACGPILVTIRYERASTILLKAAGINLKKANSRLPKVFESCDCGVLELESGSIVKRYPPNNHYCINPILQHSARN